MSRSNASVVDESYVINDERKDITVSKLKDGLESGRYMMNSININTDEVDVVIGEIMKENDIVNTDSILAVKLIRSTRRGYVYSYIVDTQKAVDSRDELADLFAGMTFGGDDDTDMAMGKRKGTRKYRRKGRKGTRKTHRKGRKSRRKGRKGTKTHRKSRK
jgi:hypothetical protein